MTDHPSLSERARELFQRPENEVYLSVVSVWEIGVKHSLGRLPLPGPPARFIPEARQQHGIDSLPLEEAATLAVGGLPSIHRDPFDRMLVCQAATIGLTILTPDPFIARYPVRTAW